MTFVDTLLPEWDREMGLTRQLLSRVPDRDLDWRPHARSRTLCGLARHLAEIPQWAASTIADAQWAPAAGRADQEGPSLRLDDILQRFDEAQRVGRAALAGKTNAELLAPWTILANGKALATMPKLTAIRTFVLNHLIHHRGQLSVYLRLRDVPIPPAYGPSADQMR